MAMFRFQELVSSTLQPDFTPDGVEVKAPEKAGAPVNEQNPSDRLIL